MDGWVVWGPRWLFQIKGKSPSTESQVSQFLMGSFVGPQGHLETHSKQPRILNAPLTPKHVSATISLHQRDDIKYDVSTTSFLPDVALGIQAREFNFCLRRPENVYSSCCWSPLGAIWQTPGKLSYAIYSAAASASPLYHKGMMDGVLQRGLSFCKTLPSLQRNSDAGPLGFQLCFLPRPFMRS